MGGLYPQIRGIRGPRNSQDDPKIWDWVWGLSCPFLGSWEGGRRGELRIWGWGCTPKSMGSLPPSPQILVDTRALQKEINALVGKLERTFSVTDELLFKVWGLWGGPERVVGGPEGFWGS